ncbi:MAG TPA: DegT/DnrJ/EryC1/StrS family aminotransferase [Candidatus Saccharimonadales bacterium]|nr:DegT/DnrJ/EryC1/StrS family aminotransferase [Candidatus Saccharimonadales bacterium]
MSDTFIVPREPRLHWKTLLPAIRNSEPLLWHNATPVHYLFWARNGIYHGLAALGVLPGENILVPSFHCTAIVEPILKHGAEVKFYDINLDVKPDLADIEAKIDNKTRAILAIHYFGFPLPVSEIKALCRKYNIFFIEDCAHVLMGKTPAGIVLGESGDISVFSWRKFLPVYDGGQLVINNPTVTCNGAFENGGALFALKATKNTFDKLMEPPAGGEGWLGMALGLPSLLMRYCKVPADSGVTALKVNNYDLGFDPASARLRMSSISRRILRHTDIAAVVQSRRRNYRRVADAVRAMPGVAALHPILPEDICPWVFPLVVHETKDLHLALRARGIPATTWGGVIHPSLSLRQFPSARLLYDNLVFLPIHQSMEEQHLRAMTQILDEVLRERRRVDEKSFDGCLSLSSL